MAYKQLIIAWFNFKLEGGGVEEGEVPLPVTGFTFGKLNLNLFRINGRTVFKANYPLGNSNLIGRILSNYRINVSCTCF